MLELVSAHRAGEAARNLRERSAIAHIDGAVSFLDGHADADTGHVTVLEEVLNRVECPEDQADICLAARQMRRLYPRFFAAAHPGRGDATGRSVS